MYLYAIIDVFSRYRLGWRLNNSSSASNAYELLQECVDLYGAQEIVNTDQGSQYTTADWENLLRRNRIRISMDGKGRCKDNIWIERFWRSIEQDYIYTHIQPMMSWSSVMALMDRFFTTMSGRIRGSVAPFLQHLTVKKLRPLYSASPIKQSP